MAKLEQPDFTFAKGINTEAPLTAFPPNFSSDEQNYDLLIDGSRRRRGGLESDGSDIAFSLGTIAQGDATGSWKWNHVAGNPTINWIVVQAGYQLFILTDEEVPELVNSTFTVNLLNHVASGSITSNDVREFLVDVSFGKGNAFVVGRYLKPFYITYDEDTNQISIKYIEIKERDFVGIDDGYPLGSTPVSLTDTHNYNLLNRGWKKIDIDTFFTQQSVHPSKSMVSFLGYRRETTANVAEQDWTKVFSSDKLVAELFQDASAPQGHFIIDPFNTTFYRPEGGGSYFEVTTWSISGTTNATQTVTLTTAAAHGLTAGVDRCAISGQVAIYTNTIGFPVYWSFDGVYSVQTTPTATTLTILVDFPSGFSAWSNQHFGDGTLFEVLAANPDGWDTDERPQATAFYGGRVWFAGISHPKLGSNIYFSQIVESDAQYGKCYQVADPTDENISDIVPSDGGKIVIPDAVGIKRLVSVGTILLVFADNGV